MRKIILMAVALLPIKLFSAVSYSLERVEVRTDETLGTFQDNGTTYGFVTGAFYEIMAYDSVLQSSASFQGNLVISPRASFPTANQVRTAITDDAVTKGIKARISSIFSLIQAEKRQKNVRPSLVNSVEGSAVVVP